MVIKVKYNGEWVKIPYLSSDHGQELVEEAPKDGKQYARQNGVWSVVNIPEVDFTDVYNAIDTKVDKVEGKGLSTNDYVTADKTKVTNINEVIEAATKNITATDISITLDKRNLVTNVVEDIELNIPASKRIFIYGGNLGKPQGIDFLLKVIEENKKREKKE